MEPARPLIAIIDDEECVRRALRRLMLSAGYQAEVFACGAEFIESLRTRIPDCAVLDLHMPSVSGFDVQQQIAAQRVQMPVIVITGHDTPESKERALAGGAVAYLRKPVHDHDLICAVQSSVKGK